MEVKKGIRSYIGDAVVKRRIEIKMEQESVCAYADVSITTLSTLENGKANISLLKLEKILDVLGLEVVIKIKEKV
ncbi:helix-turn-helix domain-containing protein [Sulfuricurvum sp.]|uniref:helix-turn-helix domain-containing protein n=1 Tax=Sulfuricurvum sp. TaxID=2025608 RepID=UPI002618187B|nr:helix-turn-helix domain-containing protein [Sulfuricurvum sp.]MDD2267564.1 helix-turn-helix domain-containing protein [Sulfuricurvum sp.]MDD2783737.1 helix-turn-helix domain-containing protein [Sulfuricurvum sp.]